MGCIHRYLLLNKGLLVVRRLSSIYLRGRRFARLTYCYIVRGVARNPCFHSCDLLVQF